MPEGQRASATAIQNHVWHLQTRNPLGNGYADAMRKVEGSPDPSGREPVSHSDDSDDGETRDEQCSHRFQGLKAKLKKCGLSEKAAVRAVREEMKFAPADKLGGGRGLPEVPHDALGQPLHNHRTSLPR